MSRKLVMTKILVADDEPSIRRVIGLILSREGYDIVEAPDGAAACQLALAEQPDVILLDVTMPVMNGFEALERLKGDEATQHVPVIMVTARGQGQDEARGLRGGALDYIAKPWAPGELEDRVRMALTYAQSNARRRAGSATSNAVTTQPHNW